MTAVRLKELGLSEKDISERNFTFTTAIEGVDDGLVERQMAAVDRLLIGTGSEAKLQLEPPQPSVEIEHVLVSYATVLCHQASWIVGNYMLTPISLPHSPIAPKRSSSISSPRHSPSRDS